MRALIPDRGNADTIWTSHARTFFGAIEQLADRCGFLKLSSQAAWLKLSFPHFELPKIAEPFVPA